MFRVPVAGKPERAQVAQLVEQGIENPRVGGSIPSLGTTVPEKRLLRDGATACHPRQGRHSRHRYPTETQQCSGCPSCAERAARSSSEPPAGSVVPCPPCGRPLGRARRPRWRCPRPWSGATWRACAGRCGARSGARRPSSRRGRSRAGCSRATGTEASPCPGHDEREVEKERLFERDDRDLAIPAIVLRASDVHDGRRAESTSTQRAASRAAISDDVAIA